MSFAYLETRMMEEIEYNGPQTSEQLLDAADVPRPLGRSALASLAGAKDSPLIPVGMEGKTVLWGLS